MQQPLNQQYDASPERIDITIFGIEDMPILKDGACIGTQRIVDYAPAGCEDMVRMQRPIEELLNVEIIDDPHSPVHNIAKARAAMIQRALVSHQHSAETPPGHLALETWAGLTPVMCKSLRKCGVRSLQELAGASEATISRVSGVLPNPRKLMEQCGMYLSSIDKTQATAALQQTQEENAALKARVAEMEAKMQAIIEGLNQGQASADGEDAPKRRGRPPRVHTDAPETEAAA